MFDPAAYGDAWAPSYDTIHAYLDPTAAVDMLAELAGTGKALELGVGTGRIAIPLAGRGVSVQGIDASHAMVDRMRAKPGGANVPVTVGDFTDVDVEGDYAVVFVVASTLDGLLTQAAQVACVRKAAVRLAPGGVFVFEGFVPDPAHFGLDRREPVDHVARHDPVQQRVASQHVVAGPPFARREARTLSARSHGLRAFVQPVRFLPSPGFVRAPKPASIGLSSTR